MADRPIIFPRLLQRLGNNRQETFGGIAGYIDNHAATGASNQWAAAPASGGATIVVLTSGKLLPVVTDGVLACGLCPEASATAANPNPPTSRRDPNRHYPWSLQGVLFLMNLTDASGNVGVANGAPTLSEAVIGASYAIHRPTSGTYAGYQMVDVDDTTNTLVTVVDKPALVDGVDNLSTDYNGLVLVRIIPSKLQAVA